MRFVTKSFALRASILILLYSTTFSVRAYTQPSAPIQCAAFPSSLSFKAVLESDDTTKVTKTLEISSNAWNRAVKVYLGNQPQGFSVAFAPGSTVDIGKLGGHVQLQVTYTPSPGTGSSSGDLNIFCGEPGRQNSVLLVPVAGEGSKLPSVSGDGSQPGPAPNISDPDPLDFGQIKQSSMKWVVFTNNSKAAVTFSPPNPATVGDFSFAFPGNLASVTVPPGDTVAASVTYKPKGTAGDFKFMRVKASIGSNSRDLVIAMQGAGLTAVDSAHFAGPIHAHDLQVTIMGAKKDQSYEIRLNPGTAGSTVIGSGQAEADGPLDIQIESSLLTSEETAHLILLSDPSIDLQDRKVLEFNSFYFHVIGAYQQGGASGADASGRFFFDFTGEYRLGKSPVSIIGNTRIGSSAQNATPTLGGFATSLISSGGSLQLNKIATIGEGWVGAQIDLLPRSLENGNTQFSMFAFYGMNGYLQPGELDQTFAFPVYNTQAYQQLVQAEVKSNADHHNTSPLTTIPGYCGVPPAPSTQITGVADACEFVRLYSSQAAFYQEGYLGLKVQRYATLWGLPSTHAAKASLSAAWGFNESVGIYRRPSTLRLEGFLPLALPGLLSIGKQQVDLPFYLFGTSELNYQRTNLDFGVSNYIFLNPASAVANTNGRTLTSGPSNTYVLTADRTRRDIYSVGVGIDLASVFRFIFKKS